MSDQGVKVPEQSQQIGQASPAAPEPTLREQVSHAFNELKAKEAPATPTPEAPKPEAVANRDEAGKFAAKPDGQKRETLTLPKEAPKPVEVKPIKAPDGWNAAAKAKFAALDPEIQAEVTRRETETHKLITAQDADRGLGKKIRETAAPYLATIKAEGGDEGAAFGAFLNYAHIMRSGTPEQKLAALQTVAKQFNVPLGSQLQQATPNQAFESLTQRLTRLESERQADLHQRQVQEQSTLTSTVEAFSSEPGHEHFETVKELMGSLLQTGQAKDLQDAYDKAIWANPEIRSTLTAAQIAEVEQKRIGQNQAQTGAARWASGSITGAPGGAKPNGAIVERSLGDEIRANMKAATGRV